MASMHDIKAALDRAATTITHKPAIGQRTYVNTAVVGEGLVCRVEEKGHVLSADLPPSMGGDGDGPSPGTLLRAALSSCVAIGVKMWAARKDVAIERIAVRVETDVDARGQFGVNDAVSPGFEAVRIHIDLVSQADAEALRDVVATSLRFSPLMDALRTAQSPDTHISIQQPVEGAL